MASEPLLKIADLRTQSSEGDVGLQGVSLDVYPATGVALIGPNGGGKQAVCRCLARQINWIGGRVEFKGRPWPNERWKAARSGALVVLANERVFDDLNVAENLIASTPWWTRDDRGDALNRILDLFPRLRERLRQPAGTLSGGEQQMLVLARALLSNPDVVVLEEPWLGLAPSIVDVLLEQMQVIRASAGTSFLWTEEGRERAIERADSVYELAGGVATRIDCGR